VAFGEFPASNDMQVQVKDGLPGARPVVDHQAEGIAHTQLLGHLASDQHQVPQQHLVIGGGVHQPGDAALGDHQYMDRCLGVNIVDRDAVLVLIEEITGNFTADDFAEYGV
jgi:hypothetical protein